MFCNHLPLKQKPPFGRRSRTPASVVMALLLAGCSADAYRLEADRAVYEILSSKRVAALGTDVALVDFRVEAAQNNLRSRLLEQIAHGDLPKVEVTLERALEVAAENSRDFQNQKERLYLAALSLTGQRNRYDVIFSGGSGASLDGTATTRDQARLDSDVSASRILATGANVFGSFVNSFFKTFVSSGGWDTSSLLSLSITQPLLRGLGSEVTLEPLTQAERSTVYAIRTYERFRRTFCVSVISEYLGVLQQQNNLSNQNASYDSLQRSTQRSLWLAMAGRTPKFEVDQAEQREFSAEDRRIAADASVRRLLDRFKVTLGLPLEIDLILDSGVLAALEGLGVGHLSLSEAEATTLAFARRLDWQNAVDQVVDAARKTRVAADALRLGLDLSGGISASPSDEKKPWTLDFSKMDWDIGLELDLPLNRVPERNTYRQSLISLDAERRDYSFLEDSIKQAVRNALRDVDAAHRSYEIQQKSVALAKDRVNSTKALVEAARAITRDYLESEDDLLASQNALTGSLVNYVVSKLSLLRDLELLDVGSKGLSIDLEALRRWVVASPKIGAKKSEPGKSSETPERKQL